MKKLVLSKYIIPVIIIAAILVLGGVMREKYLARQSIIEAELEEYKKELVNLREEINKLEKYNALLEQKIEEADRQIKKQNEIIKEREADIKKLEESRPETPAGCEGVVSHYLAEINQHKALEGALRLALASYVEKNAALELQVSGLEKQNAILKQSLERANALLDSQVRLNSELRKAWRKDKLANLAEKSGLIIFAGILVATIISK